MIVTDLTQDVRIWFPCKIYIWKIHICDSAVFLFIFFKSYFHSFFARHLRSNIFDNEKKITYPEFFSVKRNWFIFLLSLTFSQKHFRYTAGNIRVLTHHIKGERVMKYGNMFLFDNNTFCGKESIYFLKTFIDHFHNF